MKNVNIFQSFKVVYLRFLEYVERLFIPVERREELSFSFLCCVDVCLISCLNIVFGGNIISIYDYDNEHKGGLCLSILVY